MSSITYNGVPVSLMSDIELTLLNNKFRDGGQWLTNTFFSRQLFPQDDQLAIGDLDMGTAIAPYVNPCVEGRPIRGNTTASVKFIPFAYLKPKTALEPCKVVDSALLAMLEAGGMTIRGRMSDSEALQIAQIQTSAKHRAAIDARVNLMAAEVFTTGKLIVISDDQARFEVDYGRDSSATFTPATAWSNALATPVADIETMRKRSFDLRGDYGSKLIMRSSVWDALVKHQDFNDVYIKPYAGFLNPLEGGTNDTANQAYKKLVLNNMRSVGGPLEIWVYDGFYEDATGTRQYYLPAGYCGVVGNGQGAQAFGKIKDIEANFQSSRYYAKTWVNKDPSVLFLLTQSAPMVVPSHANMVVGGTGFV